MCAKATYCSCYFLPGLSARLCAKVPTCLPCAGEVAIFSTKVLAPLKRVREGHMVFVTAVAFSGDDRGLLSVSADASARTTLVAPERPSSLYMLLLGLLILLVSIALGLFSRYYRS